MIEVAEQKCSDVLSRVAGLGESANHKLLPELDLELEPRSRSNTGFIGGIDSLGDDSFPPFAASELEHFLAVSFDGFGNSDSLRRALADAFEKLGATPGPWLVDDNLIAAHENVEQNECAGIGGSLPLNQVGFFQVHPSLQLLESRWLAVDQSDDLSIEYERPLFRRGELAECFGDFGELSCLVLCIARHQPNFRRGCEREYAHAVVFRLERPAFARNVGANRSVHRFQIGDARCTFRC